MSIPPILSINDYIAHNKKIISKRTGRNLNKKTRQTYYRYVLKLHQDGFFNVRTKGALVKKINNHIYNNPNTVCQAALVQALVCLSETQDEEDLLVSKVRFVKRRKKSALLSKAEMDKHKRMADDYVAFCSSIEDNKLRLAVRMLYDTSCRRAELLSIKVKDVKKFDGKNIGASISVTGKRSVKRTVYLSESVYKEFLEFVNNENLKRDDFVIFFEGTKKEYQGDALWRRIRDHGKKVWGENAKAHPHSLRHASAITMGRKGLDIKDISEYLGHSNLATTEIYAKYEEARREKVAEKFFGDKQ
jgi:site-specific recombinase XerD